MNIRKSKKRLETKYIILIIIGIIILLLSIFAFTVKDKRNLSKPEQILKDGIVLVQNIILYPFKYIGNGIKELYIDKKISKEKEAMYFRRT